MAEEIMINITFTETTSWSRMLRSLVFVMALIVPGIIMGSAAMQWLGFIAIILVALVLAAQQNMRNKGLTPDQARARIAQLEAGIM